jgi:hypothetical protein
MPKLIIVAAIADVDNIVLYCKDGETHTINSADYRTKAIMDKVMPAINNNKSVEIEIDDYNLHNEFSERTGGLIKFYRVLKKAVLGIFDKTQPTMSVEEIESTGTTKDVSPLKEDETVVAVVSGKAIPNMEAMDRQINHVVKNNANPAGMVRFLERVASVIDERGHSVEDLLKFIKDADLPIADDGTMVAYKSLSSTDSDGVYVDLHSHKVKQGVGTRVFMSAKLVDPDRRNDCSNGLHIARRDYIRTFSGNVMVICKIAPEDIIAVPKYSPSKIRVCGYDIVALLDKKSEGILRSSNKAMTDNPDAAQLLGEIIAGRHAAITKTTEITAACGGGLIYNEIKGESQVKFVDDKAEVQELNEAKSNRRFADIPEPEPLPPVAPVKALTALEVDLMEKDPTLSPKALREQADAILLQRKADKEAKAKAKKDANLPKLAKTEPTKKAKKGKQAATTPSKPTAATKTIPEQARELFMAQKFTELNDFKKKKKKSWDSLGFSVTEENQIKAKLV